MTLSPLSMPFYPQFANAAAYSGGAFAYAGAGQGSPFGTDSFAMSSALSDERLRAYQGGGAFVFAFAFQQQMGMSNAGMAHGMGCSCHCCCGVQCVGTGFNKRIEEDPYGIAQSGQGQRSNLANSPEAMLAIKDIMSDGQSHSYEDIAKNLKEKYGIDAEVSDIVSEKDGNKTTSKGIKMGNGDYFIDGNGNGSLDQGDYKFDDAIKNLKDKYQLDDKDIKGITDRMKETATERNEWREWQSSWSKGHEHGGHHPHQRGFNPSQFGGPFAGYNQMPMFGMPALDMQWMMMFMQAYAMSSMSR